MECKRFQAFAFPLEKSVPSNLDHLDCLKGEAICRRPSFVALVAVCETRDKDADRRACVHFTLRYIAHRISIKTEEHILCVNNMSKSQATLRWMIICVLV